MTKLLQNPKHILFFFLLLMSLTILTKPVEAADKVQIVDKDTTISAKYKFIAQFNKSKTKVIPFGLEASKIMSESGKTPYLSFNPKNNNSLKGKFGVIYENVGRYEDKEIDLKITVLDWKRFGNNDSGKISFQLNNIGENNQAYYYVDQKWEFYESGTDNKVSVSGYMTINDIDSLQGVRFSEETSKGIKNILVEESAENFLSFSNTNGELAIYDDNYVLTDTNDPKAMATILYEDLDTLRFKWERNFDRSTNNPDKVFDPNISDGEYFGYIAKKPAKTELIDPIKTIEVNGEESQELDISKDKTFTFNLYHQVTDEWSNFYYNDYLINDKIDNRLSIESIRVENEEGKDVTSYFDNQTQGNNVKLAAKLEILQKSYFYNNNYKVIVNVKVKELDSLLKDVHNGKVTFDNVFTVTSGNTSKHSNKVRGILHQREIEVWHLDKINNSTLEHITTKAFDGDNYSYSSKKDFTRDNYSYMPTPEETKEGKVNGKDIELKFYYQMPLIDVSMKHIQIYTDDSTKGLPIRLKINRDYIYGKDIPELTKGKVKIELFERDSSKALIHKEYALRDIPASIEDWIIPKEGLIKNSHKNYVVKVSGIDNKEIVSSNPEINTDGYTSSERQFEVNESGKLKYKGVVMTEREINKEMEKHYESVIFHNDSLEAQKTGYGFSVNATLEYINDLKTGTDIKINTKVNSNLIDSYLNYRSENGYTNIDLDKVSTDKSFDDKKYVYQFQLPHVNVEKETGYLFTDEQVSDEDANITKELKSGGRKLYVPIWADLKDYDIYVESTKPIGVNRIMFSAEKNLNVYAYMFATIGSDTIDQDEILIEPINLENPFPEGRPEGWSQSDEEWLKK